MAEARAKIVEDGKARPAGFLTASEIEPLSTAFRKLVGLDEIQGKFKFMKSKKALLKPRVALLDLMRNQFAVSGESFVGCCVCVCVVLCICCRWFVCGLLRVCGQRLTRSVGDGGGAGGVHGGGQVIW